MVIEPHSVGRRVGMMITTATRVAFAALLFTSPWMIQWIDVMRRINTLYSGYTDFFVYPSDLFLVLTVGLGWLAPLIARRRYQRGPWYLTIPLAALVLLSFISTFASVDPALTLYHSARFLLFFGLYLVLVNTTLPPRWVALPLALAVMIQAGVAILQAVQQASLGFEYWGELTLNPLETGVSIVRYDSVRVLRAYGLTEHPNLLGGFLAFALIYVLGYYLELSSPTALTNRVANNRSRYFLLVPLALGIVALFYTFSRSAILAFGIGVAVCVFALLREPAARRVRWRPLAIVAVVWLAVLSVPIATNSRLIAQRLGLENAFANNSGEARSLNERDALIGSANRIFYARQLLGVGSGALTLGMFYLDKEFPKEYYYYQPAHLVLIDVAAELGIVGGFLWLWLMVAPLVVMWVRRAALSAHPWLAALAAAVIVTLVVGFFDYYTWFWQSGRIWQWSAWGMFAAAMITQRITRGVNE